MGKRKLPKPPYFKIKLKAVAGGGWLDDHNLPDPSDWDKTRRFKSLAAAKRNFDKNTWGIQHTKKIVQVTKKGTKTVHTSKTVFPKKGRKWK